MILGAEFSTQTLYDIRLHRGFTSGRVEIKDLVGHTLHSHEQHLATTVRTKYRSEAAESATAFVDDNRVFIDKSPSRVFAVNPLVQFFISGECERIR